MSTPRASQTVPADAAQIARAAALLREGRLVAFPTETVYGLGADARNPDAVAALFAAKGRPAHNPLIVHVEGATAAAALAVWDQRAAALAPLFWPGPLTLVLPLRVEAGLAPAATAGLATVALRAPAHPVARALLAAFAGPVVAPSANPSGQLSPTQASHVAHGLAGRVDLILAGGKSQVGLESSVLDLSGPVPRLLRAGAVLRDQIEDVIGPIEDATQGVDAAPASPGRIGRHYAPRTKLRLGSFSVAPDEAFLGFGPDMTVGHPLVARNLSPAGDMAEAAANLFTLLHQLDEAGASAIVVAPIPEVGLGVAINDRLRRAALPA